MYLIKKLNNIDNEEMKGVLGEVIRNIKIEFMIWIFYKMESLFLYVINLFYK